MRKRVGCQVRTTKYGALVLSTAAYAAAGKPRAVIVAYDDERRLVALTPSDKEHPNTYLIADRDSRYALTVNNLYNRLNIKRAAISYSAEWDGEKLIIDLNSKV